MSTENGIRAGLDQTGNDSLPQTKRIIMALWRSCRHGNGPMFGISHQDLQAARRELGLDFDGSRFGAGTRVPWPCPLCDATRSQAGTCLVCGAVRV